MNESLQLSLIVTITILAVISPGPDFAVITKNSLMFGRRCGIATALGIAAGVSVHISYTLLGFGYVLEKAVWLLEVMRYGGAAYLIWLGISAFRTEKTATDNCAEEVNIHEQAEWRAFKNGFISNASNPKTALFFIALFTQVVEPDTSMAMQAGLGLFISASHLLWFCFIAVFLTHPRFRIIFERAKTGIQRLVGVFLLALGVKLAFGN